MPGNALTLRCARCQDVRKLEFAALRSVPLWLSMVEEACRATLSFEARTDLRDKDYRVSDLAPDG